jgi:hypothetical protein
MTFDLPISERRLKNAARMTFYGMWMLFAIAAALTMIVRHSVPARTGSLWILGCGVLAFMLSFALRDMVRKVGHRNTENRIVRDVQTFLERQPAHSVGQSAPAKAAVSQTARPAADPFVPLRSADFVLLKGAAAYRTPAADPVVFDVLPSRRPVAVKADSHAVLLPMPNH